MKILEFKAVQCRSAKELETQVNRWVSEGWEISGSPMLFADGVLVCMVKVPPRKKLVVVPASEGIPEHTAWVPQ